MDPILPPPTPKKRREQGREAEESKEWKKKTPVYRHCSQKWNKQLGMGSRPDTARLQTSWATRLFKDERLQCKLCSFQIGN